jgi:hypothetical protein
MHATGRTDGFLRGVGARRAAHDDLLQALDLLARAQRAPRRQPMARDLRRRHGLHAQLSRAPCTAGAPCSRAARAARVTVWVGSRRAMAPTNCRANTSTAATCAAKLATCTCSAVLQAQHEHRASGCHCCGTAQDSRRHCRQVHHHANVAGVHLAEGRLTTLPRRLCVRPSPRSSAAMRSMENSLFAPERLARVALAATPLTGRLPCSLDRDKARPPWRPDGAWASPGCQATPSPNDGGRGPHPSPAQPGQPARLHGRADGAEVL